MIQKFLDFPGLTLFLNTLYGSGVKTESEWSSENPILKQGAMAISSDRNNMFKVGNGISTWSQLKYSKSFLEASDINSALGYSLRKITSGDTLPSDSEGNEGDIFLLRES